MMIDLNSNNFFFIEYLKSMDGKELSEFVHKLVDQNPELAKNIRSYIHFSLLDKEAA